MTAKEYLMQIKKIDSLIENKTEEVRSLYDLATKSTSTWSLTKTSGSSDVNDRMAECVAKIVDLQNEINKDIDRLIDLKKEIMKKVDQLDGISCDLIYKRYFQFKTWETIASEMNYSYQGICKLHGKVLKEIQKCIQ